MQPFVIFKTGTPERVVAAHMLALNRQVMAHRKMPKPPPGKVMYGPLVGWVMGERDSDSGKLGNPVGYASREHPKKGV